METTNLTLSAELKKDLSKDLSTTRELKKFSYDYSYNGSGWVKGTAPKLTDSLVNNLRKLRQEIKANRSLLDGLSDKGTCTIGECLYIKVAEPRKQAPTNLPILDAVFQGSTGNYAYFQRVREMLANEYPELNDLIHYDCGRMD